MESNVSKFLVKFAVLDIVATTISVGSVFGMENKEIKKPCPICLIEDLVDEKALLKVNR